MCGAMFAKAEYVIDISLAPCVSVLGDDRVKSVAD